MKKSEFADAVFGIVSTSIDKALKGLRKKVTIKVRSAVVWRETRFDRYGQGLIIWINNDGSVDLVFSETCHDTTRVRLTEFLDDEEVQKEQLALIKKWIPLVVKDFCTDEADWHVVLDFLSHLEEGQDWKDAYKEARKIY